MLQPRLIGSYLTHYTQKQWNFSKVINCQHLLLSKFAQKCRL